MNGIQIDAYLLDSSGINTNPVISNTGTIHTGSGGFNSIGQTKVSG